MTPECNSGPSPRILVGEEVYPPSDDSFLLEDSLVIERDSRVLDVGTGTGILSIRLALLGAGRVVAVDVSVFASRCALRNARLNGLSGKIAVLSGDLFRAFRKGIVFDVVVFNPPYLRVKLHDTRGSSLERAWAGGLNGRCVIDRFIEELPTYLGNGGQAFILHPSCGVQRTIRRLVAEGLETRIVAEKNLFFERLLVLHARRKRVP